MTQQEIEMLHRGGLSAEEYWRNENRRILREALQRAKQLAPEKPVPSWSPEIYPGVWWEDVGVDLALAKQRAGNKGNVA